MEYNIKFNIELILFDLHLNYSSLNEPIST